MQNLLYLLGPIFFVIKLSLQGRISVSPKFDESLSPTVSPTARISFTAETAKIHLVTLQIDQIFVQLFLVVESKMLQKVFNSQRVTSTW